MTLHGADEVVLASGCLLPAWQVGAYDSCAFHLITHIKTAPMLSPLIAFRPPLHQTHSDHVPEPSLAVRSILRPDPLYLTEHSPEHCHRASPLPPIKRGADDSFAIRTFQITSTSTPSVLIFHIHTSILSAQQSTDYSNFEQQSKNEDKRKSDEDSDKDTMAPKSNYSESSTSSSEGDRVHYNPRKEDRERSAASNTKKRAIVITYGEKTGDPARKADLDGKRWK